MNTQNYNEIVKEYINLESTREYLQDIVFHGIHSLTNDFSNDEFDYDAISAEFQSVAQELLDSEELIGAERVTP